MKKAIIWTIILLVLIGVGSYFSFFNTGSENQDQSGNGSTSKIDEKTIPNAIENFYNKYDSCMKNPPSEATGRVSEYCQNNTGMTTAAFAANLEKGGTSKAGADPIFCSQNPPESIKASSDFQVYNDKATGFVVEKFGTSQIKAQVELIKDNGVWKIDNIACPVP